MNGRRIDYAFFSMRKYPRILIIGCLADKWRMKKLGVDPPNNSIPIFFFKFFFPSMGRMGLTSEVWVRRRALPERHDLIVFALEKAALPALARSSLNPGSRGNWPGMPPGSRYAARVPHYVKVSNLTPVNRRCRDCPVPSHKSHTTRIR